MKIFSNLPKAHVKVLASIFSNFILVWVVAMLATSEPLVLTLNFAGVILSWWLAISAEMELQTYD